MYQTISEKVSVIGIFKNASFTPKKFKWNKQVINIEQITSTHEIKDGKVKKRRYAVSSGSNLYLLEYNRQKEIWILEQIWCE